VAENVYEGMFILDSNRFHRDQAGTTGKVGQLVESHGGSLLVSRLWDERRLAYPIKGHKKGTYWLTYFRLESTKLPDLTRDTEREDSILRHLFLKIDPRIVDTLVEHARTSTGATSGPAEDRTEDEEEGDAEDTGDENEEKEVSPGVAT